MKLLFDAPINELSFGNVSLNLIKEFKKKNVELGIFPTRGAVNISSFDLDQETLKYIEDAINNRYSFISEDIPALKLWHLDGAEDRKAPKQFLFTFYECSEPTEVEMAIANSQNRTIFSSKYSRDIFKQKGCDKAESVTLGFDDDFKVLDDKGLEGVIHFGLMGKFERRKHTAKIIQTWLNKYGNNNKYQLTCCVNNPFFKDDGMQQAIQQTLQGHRFTNINFLPRLQKNSEVNELLNSIDIDLTGLSGGEGWNLPAFNATCLGKWSVVLNETSHKDWATEENSILVESNAKFDCYDNMFFKQGINFNQGQFYDWSVDEAVAAMEKAESKVGQINSEGRKLAEEMSYSKTVDGILAYIQES
mgnify:FL=1|tara:strand:- start:5182 stop:6264 length:1083 start_codon:yes stop_codon:yes gene_type:complete